LIAAADLYVLVQQQASDTVRFSPLETLDPISAALVPAYGALATVTLSPGTAGRRRAALALSGVLCAAALLPGTRGPVLALVVAVAVVMISALSRSSSRRRFQSAATFAAIVGLVVGGVLSETFVDTKVNSVVSAFGVGADGTDGADGSADGPAQISSLSIRRQWLEQAIRAVPDKPIQGHGVAGLVDDTPEAHRMGVAGQKVYPHSDLVEAAYSLGLLGLLPFLVLVLVPAGLLVGLWRRTSTFPPVLIVALFAAAFMMANTSGEIGSDVILWSSAALAVVAADRRMRPALIAANKPTEAPGSRHSPMK
jgi:O-antigen ligase